ncbi:MAG: helix-turn-helix domain-containing protein [Lachnospiraceae bacterium]|jgi:transcriptional regulator with XRE-family HTH domain|nr:helix-turn-helix domain-containing protein [Lachnospiraceae bacterium]
MTLVDRISKMAKERGLTFKALEREAGLGNGTIKRWEVQSPRLDGLIKVAEYLQVSLDAIVFGNSQTANSPNDKIHSQLERIKQEQGLICDGSPLSTEESDLIAMYRLLPSHEQEDTFDLIFFKYQKYVEKKARSIYWTYSDVNSNKKNNPAQDNIPQDGTA